MAKTIFKKVVWLGRATTFLVGLAVILALSVGLTSAALAGTGVGATFNLGKTNTVNALSSLVGSTSSSMLKVDNNGSGSALDLRVGPSTTPPDQKAVAPMSVDSQAKVANLNADKVDGRDAPLWAVINTDGTTTRGFGVTSSKALLGSAGTYVVTFDRNVSSCAYVASLGDGNEFTFAGEASATKGATANEVVVGTSDSSGTPINKPFHLAVLC
jgi:hypothetical protein